MTNQEDPKYDIKEIGARLDAIQSESERGISEILALTQNAKATIEGLRRIISNNAQASQLLTELERLNAETLATCSFQDVVRQHIGITREHLNGNQTRETNDADEKLLAGPELDGQGLGQNDIDDLLK